MATITGSEVLAQALRSQGVDTMFYLMGGPMLETEAACIKLGIRAIDTRLRQLPGVTSVAAAESLPPDRLQRSNNYTLQGDEPGAPGRTSQGSGVALWNTVSDEFFSTLEIPVLRGRSFAASDQARARRSVPAAANS